MLEKTLKETALRWPKKTAIVFETEKISFKQLYDDVSRLSHGLNSIGIKQGDCITIILPNCPEFILIFYAASKLHATVLPVNPALVENEINFFVNDSNTKAIITDLQHADMCNNIISKSDNKIDLVVVGGTFFAGISFKDLFKDCLVTNNTDPYEGDILYQYSSGSTGRPKRVCKTQKNLYHEAFNFTSTTNVTSSDNILCVTPLFHAHAIGNCMLAAIYSGCTLVILENLKKNGIPLTVPFILRRERVIELIEKEKITILPAVPFIYHALADTPDNVNADLSTLRLCFSGGNFLLKETFDKFKQRFGINIVQQYGCTEAGSVAINFNTGHESQFNSVGFPMKNVEVEIVDDLQNIQSAGSTGEIIIKSLAATRGYYNMPELNKDAFKNGYFFTGDLGKKDELGLIYITGRKKLFIEVGGNKVDPLEIEDVLITHPKVKEVVVVGINSTFAGELIKAVIVPNGECQEREIVLYSKERLASFKVPQIIEFREDIPKSPLGKILRKNLI